MVTAFSVIHHGVCPTGWNREGARRPLFVLPPEPTFTPANFAQPHQPQEEMRL
jgi:hypothetical protein